jgi:hypothetical protein
MSSIVPCRVCDLQRPVAHGAGDAGISKLAGTTSPSSVAGESAVRIARFGR